MATADIKAIEVEVIDDGVAALCWPATRSRELVEALLRTARVARAFDELTVVAPPPQSEAPEEFEPWLEQCAELYGVAALSCETPVAELHACLARCRPAVVSIEGVGLLGVLGTRGRKVRVWAPGGRVRWLSVDALRNRLAETYMKDEFQRARTVADAACHGALASKRRSIESALTGIYAERGKISGIWQLRHLPSVSLSAHARAEGFVRLLVGIIALHVVMQLAFVGGWWVLGRSALAGVADPGWLAAWVGSLFILVPLTAWQMALQGRLSLRLGSWVKGQLFSGFLRMGSDRIAGEGIGSQLARIFESEALESLILHGGMAAALAVIELCVGALLVASGAGGGWHLAALGLWFVLALPVYAHNWRIRRTWTRERLELSAGLVESMLGHRTRAVQEAPSRWHRSEDRELLAYHESLRHLDHNHVRLSVLPALWMVLGVAGLCPAFVSGSAGGMELAVGVGAQLYVAAALMHLDLGFRQLVQAAISWERVGEAFKAALVPPEPPAVWRSSCAAIPGQPLIACRDLSFSYGGPRWILDKVSLDIAEGERILLCGGSGGGKSTLANLIAGLRRPTGGTILCRGLDAPALGELQWRRAIVAAPQFHENHIFTESLAFNLLMGRHWPPRNEDLQDAFALCVRLGLGPLLKRMPKGLFEQVGEMGWQLSHGERSRVYLARAMLQDAPLILLDETFAALDPENMVAAMQVVLDSGRSVVNISHP